MACTSKKKHSAGDRDSGFRDEDQGSGFSSDATTDLSDIPVRQAGRWRVHTMSARDMRRSTFKEHGIGQEPEPRFLNAEAWFDL